MSSFEIFKMADFKDVITDVISSASTILEERLDTPHEENIVLE